MTYAVLVTDGTRSRWVALLAQLSAGFVRAIPAAGSPAWPHLPGADAQNRITGMEGFARMSVAWGAWLGGPGNPTTLQHRDCSIDVLDLVVRGLADGTDPQGPWFWGHIGDRDQRIVEAAELAFALWSGRDRMVPALGRDGIAQVLSWLAEVHGRDVYADNWVLFPAIVATVSRALGWPVDNGLIDEGIDRMLAWDRGDGWYSDGDGHAFDRYTGWAVHWHLLHWADIDGDRRPRVRDRVRDAARTWLTDLPAFAAADGGIPFLECASNGGCAPASCVVASGAVTVRRSRVRCHASVGAAGADGRAWEPQEVVSRMMTERYRPPPTTSSAPRSAPGRISLRVRPDPGRVDRRAAPSRSAHATRGRASPVGRRRHSRPA